MGLLGNGELGMGNSRRCLFPIPYSLVLQLTELEGESQHGEAGQDRVDADYPEDRQQACPRTGEQEETDDDR